MLTAEQSTIVRSVIALLLDIEDEQVIPEASFLRDLGATGEDLDRLVVELETVFPLRIGPISEAVDGNGNLLPLDRLTVGEFEVILARKMGGSSTDIPRPLQLSPEHRKTVHEAIAKAAKIPLEQVRPELNLVRLGEEGLYQFTRSVVAAAKALRIEIDVELDVLARGLDARAAGTATPEVLSKLRWLVPDLDSLPIDDEDHTSTVGLIERMCAVAIERRKGPSTAGGIEVLRPALGRYVSRWSPADQEWWIGVPERLGPERYRLLLTGMLRAAFIEAGSLVGDIGEILEVAETYAETGRSPEALDRKYRSVSRWKLRRNPLWGGLPWILKPDCSLEEGGDIVFRVADTFRWTEPEAIAAIRQWERSLLSPLKAATEFDNAWRTPEVVSQARQMHDNHAFAEFPKLGAALEQAGCRNEAILDHCRDPERRHLRGDWLLTLVLADGSPATAADPAVKKAVRGKGKSSTAAGSPPAAKPKKAKKPALSARLKKKFKETLSESFGGVPVAVAWANAWQSDYLAQQAAYKRDNPFLELSPEALRILGGLCPVRRTVLPEAAVARRWELQSAEELPLGLTLWVRMSLLIWLTRPYASDMPELLQDAFVAGDDDSLLWAVDEFARFPLPEEAPGMWSYRAFSAIALRDEERMQQLVEKEPAPVEGMGMFAGQPVLRAILKRDRPAVATALQTLLDQERQAADPDCFGLLSRAAHGCYRAAQWRDPTLVADFDVTAGLPWDTEFHAASLATPRPLDGFDFSTTPAELRDWLMNRTVPPWARKLKR